MPSPQVKYLYLAATLGFCLIASGVVVGISSSSFGALTTALLLQALGASVLFPVLVSFVYDKFRERWLGDEVWRLFNELAEGGIARVYKDREYVEARDNAQSRLSTEFRELEEGEVRIMGASLRVFFNPLGPFSKDLESMLKHEKARIRALVNQSDSPEAANRTRIEEPGLSPTDIPQSKRDLESSMAGAKNLNDVFGRVEMRSYSEAPYCTAVIFPHICYFSPNIIAPEVPVRLPMILFREGSHGYRMVAASFEALWDSPTTQAVK